MKLYRIATAEKKNVFIRTECTVLEGIAQGKTFYTEEWYRWGHCTVEVEDDVDPPAAAEDPYQTPLSLDDDMFIVVDQESDDGCSLQFEFGDEWTEEEKDAIGELWNEGDFWDAVQIDDCFTHYYGPLEVTELDNYE